MKILRGEYTDYTDYTHRLLHTTAYSSQTTSLLRENTHLNENTSQTTSLLRENTHLNENTSQTILHFSGRTLT